jgi:small-conductance mechanosensitive channel
MNKKPNFVKAIVFGAVAFVLMTLFWRFLGNLVSPQTGYLAWARTLVRKLTTLGFTIIAFFGGLA